MTSVAEIPQGVRCSYAGQICTPGTRVLVHVDVYDQVLDRLVGLSDRVRVGDPLDDATHVGRVAACRGLETVAAMVERGEDEATLVRGGHRARDLPGYHFEPLGTREAE